MGSVPSPSATASTAPTMPSCRLWCIPWIPTVLRSPAASPSASLPSPCSTMTTMTTWCCDITRTWWWTSAAVGELLRTWSESCCSPLAFICLVSKLTFSSSSFKSKWVNILSNVGRVLMSRWKLIKTTFLGLCFGVIHRTRGSSTSNERLGVVHRHRPASVLSTKGGISCYLVFEDNLSSLRHHHLAWQLGQDNRMLARFRMSASGLFVAWNQGCNEVFCRVLSWAKWGTGSRHCWGMLM